MASSSTETRRCRLLELPWELRLAIYSFISQNSRFRLGTPTQSHSSVRRVKPTLLLLCRTIYDESRDIFYKHATLVFDFTSKEGVWGSPSATLPHASSIYLKDQLVRAMHMFQRFELKGIWETRDRRSMFGENRVRMILDMIALKSPFEKVNVTIDLGTAFKVQGDFLDHESRHIQGFVAFLKRDLKTADGKVQYNVAMASNKIVGPLTQLQGRFVESVEELGILCSFNET